MEGSESDEEDSDIDGDTQAIIDELPDPDEHYGKDSVSDEEDEEDSEEAEEEQPQPKKRYVLD